MNIQRYKYSRTTHLPWSRSVSADDLVYRPHDDFQLYPTGTEVVITEKMDGENTSIYHDGLHARSIDSKNHPSRDWIKRLQGRIGHLIPPSMRLCGENLYAQHSLAYHSLDHFFLLFSVWEGEQCLSWDETLEWAELLELTPVPTLYRGPWNEKYARELALKLDTEYQEGYVVRPVTSFLYQEFSDLVYKWVRPHHVQTDQHWMHQAVVPNRLRESSRESSLAKSEYHAEEEV